MKHKFRSGVDKSMRAAAGPVCGAPASAKVQRVVHTARDRQRDMDTESVARHLCDVGSVSQIVWILSYQAHHVSTADPRATLACNS